MLRRKHSSFWFLITLFTILTLCACDSEAALYDSLMPSISFATDKSKTTVSTEFTDNEGNAALSIHLPSGTDKVTIQPSISKGCSASFSYSGNPPAAVNTNSELTISLAGVTTSCRLKLENGRGKINTYAITIISELQKPSGLTGKRPLDFDLNWDACTDDRIDTIHIIRDTNSNADYEAVAKEIMEGRFILRP